MFEFSSTRSTHMFLVLLVSFMINIILLYHQTNEAVHTNALKGIQFRSNLINHGIKIDSTFGKQTILPPPPDFRNHVFLGHYPAPDLDSVASAVGAAAFFGGIPAIPGPINAESMFALNYFKSKHPYPLMQVYNKTMNFVLVDHNSEEQRAPSLDVTGLRGIFDHHTLAAKSVRISRPTFIDIRPWGSCSTIIAYHFMEYGVEIPQSVAGILMAGIISDTLHLKGPTTTPADRIALGWLANHAKVHDTLEYAMKQFRAKANTSGMSDEAIVLTDFKTYSLKTLTSPGKSAVEVGWSTIETVEPFFSVYKSEKRTAKFSMAMQQIKQRKSLDMIFVSVVDIVNEKSFVVCLSNDEKIALEHMFQVRGKSMDGYYIVDSGSRVSRKKEFMPPLRKYLIHGV